MGRDLIIAGTLATIIAIALGCGSSSWLVQPPGNLGDAVIVPGDIKPLFDSIIALDSPGLPSDLAERPLSDRRAYSYYMFSEYTTITDDSMSMMGRAGPLDWLDNTARELADRLGAQLDDGGETIQGEPMYTLNWTSPLSRGELAWFADWIHLQYPDILLVEPVG